MNDNNALILPFIETLISLIVLLKPAVGGVSCTAWIVYAMLLLWTLMVMEVQFTVFYFIAIII